MDERRLTPIRCRVERLFGLMKRSYGYARVRDRGHAPNRGEPPLICMAINLRRADGRSPAFAPVSLAER